MSGVPVGGADRTRARAGERHRARRLSGREVDRLAGTPGHRGRSSVKSTDPPLGFGTIPAVSVTGDPAIAVFRAGVREAPKHRTAARSILPPSGSAGSQHDLRRRSSQRRTPPRVRKDHTMPDDTLQRVTQTCRGAAAAARDCGPLDSRPPAQVTWTFARKDERSYSRDVTDLASRHNDDDRKFAAVRAAG
jgi:hypothetical protein